MIRTCIRDNCTALGQGLDVLALLTPEHYRTPIPECFDGTPGGHLRHVVEHYDSLLRGLPSGRVDYENRPRDAEVERDPDVAAQRVHQIIKQLGTLTADRVDVPLEVRVETACADAGHPWAPSSLLRELEFLLSHTVHHYALIAIIARLQGVALQPDFGVAPSTLRHRRQAAGACAR